MVLGALVEPARRALQGLHDAIALLAASLLAISFGLNYGVSNHNSYLLLSKQLLDEQLYTNDWLVSRTTHYHIAFRYVSAPLIALNREGWLVAFAQTVAVTAGMMFVHHMLRGLLKPTMALAAFLATVAVAFLTRTTGVNVTYVFDEILQPSTLGSVGLLAAAAFFSRGRWLQAGVAIALSGLFHANFLLLELGSFGIASLMMGRRDFVPRSVRLFLPPLLVLVLFIPMYWASAGRGEDAAVAQTFYMRVRAPHHFNLKPSEPGLMASVAWIALGMGFGARVLAHRVEARRLAAVMSGLLVVVGFGLLFSSLWEMRTINMMFAWRVMPHVELLSAALFLAGVAQVAQQPEHLWRAGPSAFGMVVVGATMLGVFGAYHGRAGLAKTVLAIIIVAFAGAALTTALNVAVDRTRGKPVSWAGKLMPWILTLCALVAVVHEARAKNRDLSKTSNLYNGGDRPMNELCGWVKTQTPKDAVFLTPPDNESFRFQCERAIVVDWKTTPIIPADLLEWIRRLQDVTGKETITSRSDLGGYALLDDGRLDKLRRKYNIDFVVLRTRYRPHGLAPTYKGTAGYTVYDLRDLPEATNGDAGVEY